MILFDKSTRNPLDIKRIPQKTRDKVDMPKGYSVIETQISPNINLKYYFRSAMP